MSEWKETEVGKIPEDWKVLTIDEIKSTKKGAISMGPFGSNIKADNFVEDGVPVIRGGNLNDFIFGEGDFVFLTPEKADSLKNSNCFRGDIIFTHRGTIGQVGIIPEYSKYERYVVSQSGMKLTVNEKIVSSEYVHLFFKSRKGQYLLLRNKSQTGVPAIGQPTTSLREIPIPIPPKHESDFIKNVILGVQNKITLLRQQNETLEELAQLLFRRWFVDFEFPDKDGKPYKNNNGKMVESELGEIPEGWEVGKIKDFGKVICGKTPSKDKCEFYGNDYPLIKIPDMHNATYPLETEDNISTLGHLTQMNKLIPAFSINVSCIATVGLVTMNPVDAHTNQQINSIIPKKDTLRYYAYLYLTNLKKILENIGSGGSATLNVNTSVFSNITVLLPHTSALKKFHNITLPIFSKILINQKKIQTLTQLRDTLFPKLMSGEVRVKTD